MVAISDSGAGEVHTSNAEYESDDEPQSPAMAVRSMVVAVALYPSDVKVR